MHSLVIDVGNSFTKTAIFNGDELLNVEKHERISVDFLSQLFKKYNISKSITSVVGSLDFECEQFIIKKAKLIHFSSSTPTPIVNLYKTPSTLGADRLAAAVAANTLFPSVNVLSVDCGTAMTFDLVTKEGEYLGGAISPGISTRFKALNHFTQKLPLIEIADNFQLIGYDTKSSILSGVLNGVINEIDGYINSVRMQFSPLEIVFTGGDAFFLDKKLKNSIFVNPNLVLFGLNRILNYNEDK